ncbi:uncharacterized protein LY79DRAFT_559460 [Colletotrichum navitas]|uniref:Uncharacterized protein n=1 Tax=Colletotrichum navitas TaxID=681940 RepID=A0AAD8PWN9_9PEZI|nr:uncharacterized protein LY79DRAFT_559460 [Colletotrichum navitas]KAK1585183.1 hypothetical protein LY79DRAFT_559460 [Colletotrichum navitas]
MRRFGPSYRLQTRREAIIDVSRAIDATKPLGDIALFCVYMYACVCVGAGSSRDSNALETSLRLDVRRRLERTVHRPGACVLQGQLSTLEQDPVPPPNSWDVLENAVAGGWPISRILSVWPSLESSSTVDLLLMSTQAGSIELLSFLQWPECEPTGSGNLPLTLSPAIRHPTTINVKLLFG